MAKSINVLLSLKDRFTAPMRQVGNTTKDTERKLTAMRNRLNNFGTGINNKFLGIAGSIGKMGLAMTGLGAFAGVGAIVEYGKKALDVAKAAELSQTVLRNSIANNNSLYDKSAASIDAAQKQLNDYAAQWGKVGVISAGTIRAGYTELNKWNVPVDKVNDLSEALTNLVAGKFGINATAEDAQLASQAIGRAFNGDVAGLTKMKIPLTEAQKLIIKNGTEAERLATINEVVNGTFSKQNEILANTPDGQLKRMKNQQAALMATIGKGLLPMQKAFIDMASTIMPIIAPVIQDIFGLFSGAFTWIAEVINENKDSIQEGLSSAMNEVKFVISSLGKVIRWCADNLGFLVPVLKAVAGGFVAFNGISKIMPLIKGIVGGLMSVIKVVRVIVAVLSANPILIAIMAVVAGIYLLVTHWDEIKEVAIEVWTAVSEFISETWDGIVSTVTGFIDRVSALISDLYESIITTLRPILDDVTQIFNGITDFLTGVFTGNWDLAFSGLVQIFTGYFDIIRNVAEGVLNWVQDKLQWAADAIQGIRDTGSAIINGTVGKLVGDGNATGTEYWQGGLTYVNENQRGEIINLPNGSQVIPHDESMKQLANSGGGVTVNMTIQGNVIGNEAFMNECGKHITEKIMLAMNNM
jgi:putative membrane protein|uniref:Minor tail protein n=2 Tax=unclassified Caudoviricetes TaxID=2788787 RepID=A0A8S5N9Q7_9CAUD|nr:MAG TPA: minor tail protein [Siphoviridae sp. ctkBO7]DAD91127.1 MAG TPA: minor tail protein [Siphoviridae sp. ctuaf34]